MIDETGMTEKEMAACFTWKAFLLFGIYTLLILVVVGGLVFVSWLEYKDWQDTKQLIRSHNGTCINKGYAMECSYSEEPVCLQNGKSINCSELRT